MPLPIEENQLLPTWESLSKNIFIPKCVVCHNPSGQAPWIDVSNREGMAKTLIKHINFKDIEKHCGNCAKSLMNGGNGCLDSIIEKSDDKTVWVRSRCSGKSNPCPRLSDKGNEVVIPDKTNHKQFRMNGTVRISRKGKGHGRTDTN
jgi:hypothetical protein